MKGHVYKRGKSWYYLFDIEPDPLTGKRRQAKRSGYRTEREAWKAMLEGRARTLGWPSPDLNPVDRPEFLGGCDLWEGWDS
jgi:hypothetical protein